MAESRSLLAFLRRRSRWRITLGRRAVLSFARSAPAAVLDGHEFTIWAVENLHDSDGERVVVTFASDSYIDARRQL